MATSAAKLQSSPRHNILQPKRFNVNHNSSVVLSSGNCNESLGSTNGNRVVQVSKEGLEESPVFGTSIPNMVVYPLETKQLATTPQTPAISRSRPPNTMAKRNARERNRVKQVNQGFQTLKQHIPEPYRLKKMSKVDTLRCALNYIQSLEKMLDFEAMPGPMNMSNEDFQLEDDFSPESLSSSQMETFCENSGENSYFGQGLVILSPEEKCIPRFHLSQEVLGMENLPHENFDVKIKTEGEYLPIPIE